MYHEFITEVGKLKSFARILLAVLILCLVLSPALMAGDPQHQAGSGPNQEKKAQTGQMDQDKSPQGKEGPPGQKPPGQGSPQEKSMGMGMPPAIVVVDQITSGMISPESEFIGTVFFDELSQVASEMEGIAMTVGFQEGDKVKLDQELVRLDSELLYQTLLVTKASYDQALASLEKAKLDFNRTRRLFEEKTVPEQKYDDDRYNVIFLEKSLNLLNAQLESVEAQLKKKIIYAPFDGWIIEKNTERGEWVAKGGVVATMARQGAMDIRVNVPQTVLPFLKPDMNVRCLAAGKEYTGTILSVIPSGNVETRTFPVRIRIQDPLNLAEGMEAGVRLPIGETKKSLVILRDAVIEKFGQNVIFIVENNTAIMMPVAIVGYAGQMAGVEAQGIREGTKVVIKGNERIQSGQPVVVAGPQ